MNNFIIRKFKDEDAFKVAKLIEKTLNITNSKDYSKEYIDNIVMRCTEDDIKEKAQWTNFYIVCDKDKIIGSGAIGPYWNSEDESSLFSIFVDPDYQGKGIGKDIINTLENDGFFLKSKRIEIPSSITAVEFYKKLGYDFKNKLKEIDSEGLYRLEKFR